jgi:multiple sugar transport system substrate-binding protein
MRRHTRLGALAVAVATATTLTACGGDPGGSSGPVSLRMTVWTSNEAHLKLFNDIAAEYKAGHPEVADIRFDPLPFENYTTTVTTQVAGGNPPDLAWVFENAAPDFVGSGALVPLNEKLQQTEGYEFDDLVPSTMTLWERDGEVFAYPFSNSPFGVFVNTDLLAQAGRPTASQMRDAGMWDWQNVLAANSAVHAATGKAGLVIRDFDFKTWDNLATFWTGWGAEPWSSDGTTCAFDQPPMVDAMTTLHKAIFVDQAMPGPGTAADFFAGDAAMTVTQISRASLLADATFGWELLPLPAGPTGPYSVMGQAGIGVFAQSENAEQAADFLAFFTNPANSAKLAAYFPPPRRSQLNAETLGESNPLLSPEQLQAVVVDQIDDAVVKPSHTGQAELSQQVRAGLDPLWRPAADVPAVLVDVCANIAPQLRG